MTEELFLKLVGNIGVPAVICLYTLFGVNKTLRELTDAINKMAADVQKIKELENRTHELTYKFEKLQNDLSLKLAHMNWKDS